MLLRTMPHPDNVVILNGRKLEQVVDLKIEASMDQMTRVTVTLLVDELATYREVAQVQRDFPEHMHMSDGAGKCEVCGKSLTTLTSQ